MSYSGSKADACAAIASVELSENSHTSSGTSPILKGASGPGGIAATTKPGGEVLTAGRLRAGIKPDKVRTGSLTRKYASTGSN